VVYGLLAFTFAVFASGVSKNSSQSTSDFTAKLMGAPAGVVLLIAIGLAIIISGAFYVYRGVTRKFMEDLQDPGSARTASNGSEPLAMPPKAWCSPSSAS
jgi:hypothetical protein